MAFYRPEQGMQSHLAGLIDRLADDGRPGLHDQISVTWVRYHGSSPVSGSGTGAGWADQKQRYPASVVKLIYAVAAEHWLQRDLIPDSEELRRALLEMLADSSNDATGLIVDLLTGTTSGPTLRSPFREQWEQQRFVVNDWLQTFGWPELEHINCCQKTWGDGPYGREKAFYRDDNSNRNALCTAAVGRMLEAVMTDAVLSPPGCQRLRDRLLRSLDLSARAADPENQVDGFLGGGLPSESLLWSKAGWMSQARHDAAWWALKDQPPTLLVVFSEGRKQAADEVLLPSIAKSLAAYQDF